MIKVHQSPHLITVFFKSKITIFKTEKHFWNVIKVDERKNGFEHMICYNFRHQNGGSKIVNN